MSNYPFLRFPGFRLKAVTLSYDDGTIFDRKMIEILDRYGLKATFNLNSGMFGTYKRALTAEDAIALYTNSPHEVAAHGVKHLSLSCVPEELALRDVLEDRIALEKMFGRIVKGFAYANGKYDDRVVAFLKSAGIEYARTVVSTEKFDVPTDWLRLPATCHHNNPRLMELAKKFIEEPENERMWRNTPRLFYLWGHSYEFNDNDNWQILEDFASYVGGREDVWYATNGEIYRYVKAYDGLRFSADGTMAENPSSTDVYLCWKKKNVLCPAGKCARLD